MAGLTSALAASGAAGADVEMPSGLTGHLQEIIVDDAAARYRFRFVAPAFSTGAGLETVAADLDHLCAEIALSEVPEGAQIIISLADQPSEFGVAAPNVTQVFEAYRAENGRCMWEEF
ncbi:MAG: DUF6497 family protein [Pseudomonadota bacterium]